MQYIGSGEVEVMLHCLRLRCVTAIPLASSNIVHLGRIRVGACMSTMEEPGMTNSEVAVIGAGGAQFVIECASCSLSCFVLKC